MKIPQKITIWAGKLRNLFFFLFGIAVISMLFPKEGKFRYEFQKGKPWMHDVLIAPFNFPIYKGEEIVKAELDSLMKDFQPYFRLDTNVIEKVSLDFQIKVFPKAWQVYTDNLNKNGYDISKSGIEKKLSDEYKYYMDEIGKLIGEIYKRGIVDDPLALENISNSDKLISVIDGQLVESRQVTTIFTQKTAFEYFRKSSAKLKQDISNNHTFISILDPMDLIFPNLFYDQETTELIKKSFSSEINLSSGMIQAGEKIIGLGEPINDLSYRILQSLKREYETNPGVQRNMTMIVIGQILLSGFVFLVFYLFLTGFRQEILGSGKKTFLLIFLMLLMAFLGSLAIKSESLNLYVVPFVLLPIIIKTFYDSRLALFVHILTILVIGFWAPNAFEFIFMNFIVGVVAIFTLRTVYKRGILFVTAVLTLLTYSLVYGGMGIIQEGKFLAVNWNMLAWFSGNALLVLASYPLIYIFEKLFGFLSDATLVELSDSNQKLLRELAEKAPGTFQHSLQVANLAEEAARVVGANHLLIRTGALYHDIGKMNDPEYFIENIQSGYNPHDRLSFEESAEKIIGHVTKGVDLAKKWNLPKQIVDFIQTHHGTTTVQYFYKSFLKKFPDAEVDQKKFTYPGPLPESREQSILMMADSIEAASRSMKVVNQEILDDLVESIVEYQQAEKQFENSDLTLKEITAIKELFKKRLRTIYHARIEYPK
ncbi:MAG: HDIG domain-containing protein [Bacteroidales bacterium]|nr:HDIG domain-containing protein [Bacteroidales bacterium]